MRLLLMMLLMWNAAPTLAQSTGRQSSVTAHPVGIWALRASDETIFRLEVRRTPSGWTGTWVRPQQFDLDGDAFTNVAGPIVSRAASGGRAIEGGVELTFLDPRPGATPDVFELRTLGDRRAQLKYQGFPIGPFMLTRETGAMPLGPWDRTRRYIHPIEYPTNSEMTAMFGADQAARANHALIDWSILTEEDRKRRARTQQLLDSGALNSADDYYHAAFVFQHGDKPADYLKAHLLATIAAARGKSSAAWIAAATLDRYLMNIGQPQVLGTQFQTDKQGKTTQGDYDRTLLSDALRQAMGGPTLADQEKRRAMIEENNSAAPNR